MTTTMSKTITTTMSDYDDDDSEDSDSEDYGENNSGDFEGDDGAARFTIEFPSIYRIKSRRLLCIQLGLIPTTFR